MRVITEKEYREIRIGVRRDGDRDGKPWRVYIYFLDPRILNEEIILREIQFASAVPETMLRFHTDLKRDNPGKFLAWLNVRPTRIEIDDGVARFTF